MKFNELKLNKKIIKALDEMEFSEMMPIQEKTFSPIMEGKDVVGQAQTGTGKTAAFVIPILETIKEDNKCTEYLIMAPTRELALQIVNEFRKIGKYFDVKVAAIVGGMDIKRQRDVLKTNPQIIVATPGRLIDHLNRKRINLKGLKSFIVDEVDEMFKSGFKEEIDEIIKFLPEKKQTLLFSATISNNVKKVVEETCDDTVYISISKGLTATKNIKQECIVLKEKNKFKTLLNLLEIHNPKLAIIFGRTKRRADELNEALIKSGFKSAALHGDLTQSQRNIVMKKFKNDEINILVATDVAARGIDVKGVSHIYNFDLPQEVEFYVHRIGRTGRAGKEGNAISFAREAEMSHIERISKETNSKIEITFPPSNKDMKVLKNKKILENIEKLNNKTEIVENQELITILDEKLNKEEALSIIVDLLNSKDKKEIALTGEPPVKTNSRNRNQRRSNRRGPRRDNDRNRNRNNRSNRSERSDRNDRSDRKKYEGNSRNRNNSDRSNRRRNTNRRKTA